MNNIYSNIVSIPKHFQASFTNDFLPKLTPQRLKIAAVVGAIFVILSITLTVVCCTVSAKKHSVTQRSKLKGKAKLKGNTKAGNANVKGNSNLSSNKTSSSSTSLLNGSGNIPGSNSSVSNRRGSGTQRDSQLDSDIDDASHDTFISGLSSGSTHSSIPFAPPYTPDLKTQNLGSSSKTKTGHWSAQYNPGDYLDDDDVKNFVFDDDDSTDTKVKNIHGNNSAGPVVNQKNNPFHQAFNTNYYQTAHGGHQGNNPLNPLYPTNKQTGIPTDPSIDLNGKDPKEDEEEERELTEIEKTEQDLEKLRNQIADEREFVDVLKTTLSQLKTSDGAVKTSDKTDKTETETTAGDTLKTDEVQEKPDSQASDLVKDQDNVAKVGNDEIMKTLETIDEKEANLIVLTNELNALLASYPAKLYDYLEDQYTNHRRVDVNDVYMRITMLEASMEAYKADESFIEGALTQIDRFLTVFFFTTPEESCLPEEKKVDLIVFHQFFNVLNNHIHVIEKKDPELALKLKIKLANLPLHNDLQRDKFPNIYLGEREQLFILVPHFQKLENELMAKAIHHLQTKQLTEEDVTILAKLVVQGKSHLNDQHRNEMRAALQRHMGTAPKHWDDFKQVCEYLKRTLKTVPSYALFQVGSNNLEDLHRAAKAKKYFESQLNLPPHDIRIPRWYHATFYVSLRPILESEIEVRHKKMYAGAWVSNQREPEMGDCTLIFTHNITSIDNEPFIGFEKGKTRWRGLQKNIPMKNSSGKSYLTYVGLPEATSKVNKAAIATVLKNMNISGTPIFRTSQVDYMHREILRAIGNPNLTEKWWGKGDVEKLQRPRKKG